LEQHNNKQESLSKHRNTWSTNSKVGNMQKKQTHRKQLGNIEKVGQRIETSWNNTS